MIQISYYIKHRMIMQNSTQKTVKKHQIKSAIYIKA